MDKYLSPLLSSVVPFPTTSSLFEAVVSRSKLLQCDVPSHLLVLPEATTNCQLEER